MPEQAYPDATSRNVFVTEVLERVRAVPGVASAATTMNPFSTGLSFGTAVHVEDRPAADGQPHLVQFRRISPEYFDALSIPLLQGRAFDARDVATAQPIVMISRSFANRFWPGEDAVGKRIKRGPTATQWSVVVGVAGDVLDVSLGSAARETVYAPVLQDNPTVAPVSLVVRTEAHPSTFIGAIKRAVWDVDARQPLANIVLMEQFLSSTLGPQRFRATLIAVCGMLGVLLATIGIYGVTARSVSERRREIGIRLALGESHGSAMWTISSRSVKSVVLGAVGGIAISLLVRTGLSALLPELQGGILWFSVALGIGLVTVGAAAAMLAARAATSVAPLDALRVD